MSAVELFTYIDRSAATHTRGGLAGGPELARKGSVVPVSRS